MSRYNIPPKGTTNWHEPLNENFKDLDIDVEHRGLDADKSNVTPADGAKYFATDTGTIYLGDGVDWNKVPGQDGGGREELASTINVPSDAATVDDALAEVDDMVSSTGHRVEINIESGHELQTNVSKSQVDHRHVTITSEDATVTLADEFPDTNIFQYQYGSHTPYYDIFLDADRNGSVHDGRAFLTRYGSIGIFEEGAGVTNSWIGISGTFGSTVVADQCVVTDCGNRCVEISNGSRGYFQNSVVSGSGNMNFRIGDSYAQVADCDATGGELGVRASTGSVVNATRIDVSNNWNGFDIEHGSIVNGVDATGDNCGHAMVNIQGSTIYLEGANSDSCDRFVFAEQGSSISAHGATVSNTVKEAIRASDASTVAFEGSITDSGDDGILVTRGSHVSVAGLITGSNDYDVAVQDGSTASLHEGNTTTSSSRESPHESDVNIAFNTVTGKGIIFCEDPEL